MGSPLSETCVSGRSHPGRMRGRSHAGRMRGRSHADRMRGLSLVEVMVALALGLLLVAAVATLLVSHFTEHRRLLAEVRLMQDLRAAADLVTRDLRRAGYRGLAEMTVASGGAGAAANPYAGIWPEGSPGPVAAAVGYSYSRDDSEDGVASSNEFFGFRLNTRTHVLEARLGGTAIAPDNGDSWQPLTDPRAIRITRFAVTHEVHSIDLLALCTQPACPGGSTTCPPRQQVSVVDVEIGAADPHDSTVARQLRTTVRVRNDTVSGACPA
jgi:prepilin peptidase dependent protein B